VHADVLPWTTFVYRPTLVPIAQAVFILEYGQTDGQSNKETDATERPTRRQTETCTCVCGLVKPRLYSWALKPAPI